MMSRRSVQRKYHGGEPARSERVKDDNDLPTCTLKVIPPKCISICQPCDVYFYRQVKNYIPKIQSYWTLCNQNSDLTTRKDMIRIQSLIHNQLQEGPSTNQWRWSNLKVGTKINVFMNVHTQKHENSNHPPLQNLIKYRNRSS